MKIRIKGNALRIRLQQQELDDLSAQGQLTERIAFGPAPDQCLAYRVRVSHEKTVLEARLEANCITVTIPFDLVSELVHTDRVGLEVDQCTGDGQVLHILVEKDFKCLTPREEDADAFPHPDEALGHTC